MSVLCQKRTSSTISPRRVAYTLRAGRANDDLSTKLLRKTGNQTVHRALNHADIKTTVRDAHVLDDEVPLNSKASKPTKNPEINAEASCEGLMITVLTNKPPSVRCNGSRGGSSRSGTVCFVANATAKIRAVL
jgi:hypothetical protein